VPESLATLWLKTASHAARRPQNVEKLLDPSATTRPSDVSDGSVVPPNRNDIAADQPQQWKDLEIVFLGEFRVQVRDRESLNYAELDFADTRGGKSKPNLSWLTFRQLAESNGQIRIARSNPKRVQLEKQIQQIRAKLRKHFGISGDPLPFFEEGAQVGYRAEFRVRCSSSYQE
jgi:hypothetical protein